MIVVSGHFLLALDAMGTHPPNNPWPFILITLASILFVAIVAGAAMLVNRREAARKQPVETDATHRHPFTKAADEA